MGPCQCTGVWAWWASNIAGRGLGIGIFLECEPSFDGRILLHSYRKPIYSEGFKMMLTIEALNIPNKDLTIKPNDFCNQNLWAWVFYSWASGCGWTLLKQFWARLKFVALYSTYRSTLKIRPVLMRTLCFHLPTLDSSNWAINKFNHQCQKNLTTRENNI